MRTLPFGDCGVFEKKKKTDFFFSFFFFAFVFVNWLTDLCHTEALKWSVDDVIVWLESKGLGSYAEFFKKSKVNGESLLGLSEAQIRDELYINQNPLHLRSMLAARNALLGSSKGKDSGALPNGFFFFF